MVSPEWNRNINCCNVQISWMSFSLPKKMFEEMLWGEFSSMCAIILQKQFCCWILFHKTNFSNWWTNICGICWKQIPWNLFPVHFAFCLYKIIASLNLTLIAELSLVCSFCAFPFDNVLIFKNRHALYLWILHRIMNRHKNLLMKMARVSSGSYSSIKHCWP